MEVALQCQLCASCFFHLNPTTISNLLVLAKIKDLSGLWLEQDDHQPRHICPSCLNDLNTSIMLKRRIQRIHNEAMSRRKSGSDQDLKSSESDVEPEVDFCDFVLDECRTAPHLDLQEGQLSNSENYTIHHEFTNRKNQIISEQEAGEHDSNLYLDNEDEENRPHNLNDQEFPKIKPKKPLIGTDSLPIENLPKNVGIQSPSTGIFIEIGTEICLPKRNARTKPPISVPEDEAAENIVPAKGRTGKMQSLECPECRMVFKTAYNLKIHSVRHTGQRDFQCTFCDRRFVSKYLGRLHERVRHMGEKPFRCRFCSNTFFTSSTKSRHERIRHIRDQSYQCDECGKRFNTKTCLNKHKFLHTGLKPFSCDICNVAFAQRSRLRSHFNSKAHQKKATAILDSNQCSSGDELQIALSSVLEDAQ